MNNTTTSRADTGYAQAERQAAAYFELLSSQVKDQSYIPLLIGSMQLWQRKHVRRPAGWSRLFRGKRKPDNGNWRQYIQWLNYAGKLDGYLIRSVSYAYLRDLGQSLDTPGTGRRIRQFADDLKRYLLKSLNRKEKEQAEMLSLAGFYRWAQKEGIESAAIWLIGKLKSVAAHLPEGLDAEHAQRKLIKIIIGVVMHVLDELGEDAEPAERARRLDEGIRLGYGYGLTYPFIDDLLDSPILSADEKQQFAGMIRIALLTGEVPAPGEWREASRTFILYVHSELREAFETIKRHMPAEAEAAFLEQAYIFFHAQETDRAKTLASTGYSNEELYVPVILKSASSRLIVRPVIGAPGDEGFAERTFHYGIYNQLSDDLADMADDLQAGAVTTYTYYWQHRGQRSDLVNPFELYFAVISHLIHEVYRGNEQAREVILSRAVNGLKRYRQRAGDGKYNELMGVFASGMPQLREQLQQLVDEAEDVEFFDKLLRDELISNLKRSRTEKEAFHATVKSVRERINSSLPLIRNDEAQALQEPLTEAANYSLEGDGKRLRPVLTWMMGVQVYGLDEAAVLPLLKSLEYMHTASLIFDDLPSQDNADTRRGRATLHQLYDSATAELAGIYLMQKATEEQASLTAFDAKRVLAMIHYSASRAGDICRGQAMDLHAKGQPLTLEQLNTLCFYKTGIAFEAALVMPAMLGGAAEAETDVLRKFAYHAGIAFQIKDDLLDAEGQADLIGKPVGKDQDNNSSTFVSILGLEGARQALWEHYCLAMEALNGLPRDIAFLRHLLDYLANRDR